MPCRIIAAALKLPPQRLSPLLCRLVEKQWDGLLLTRLAHAANHAPCASRVRRSPYTDIGERKRGRRRVRFGAVVETGNRVCEGHTPCPCRLGALTYWRQPHGVFRLNI